MEGEPGEPGEPGDHDALIARFTGLTGVAPHEAQQYLETNQWDLASAATEYYASLEEAADSSIPLNEGSTEPESDQTESLPSSLPAAQSGRALGGGSLPQPIPTTSSMPPPPPSGSKQPPKKKFATLGDLGGSGPSGHAGHGHDDDDDDDDDDNQDLFAGGEKSALAVQNPDDIKRKIIERAKRDAGKPRRNEPAAPTSRFTGNARTLGGDDTPSELIEDPNATEPSRPAAIERHLHFWEDGFSVDDGPLYRSDDPANAQILAMIRAGRAPITIMNVDRDQEVEVKLEQHAEKYVAPKKKYTPFAGGGQRLGSPTPGPRGATDHVPTATTTTSIAATSTTTAPPSVQVNESEPTISLQIRLGDGTRLVSRFNITHTIGDVYSFVNASSPSSQGRNWVLMTTFPSKELQDKTLILGDLAEFRRGGVVVQKWQ